MKQVVLIQGKLIFCFACFRLMSQKRCETSSTTSKVVSHSLVPTSVHNTYNNTFETQESLISTSIDAILSDPVVFKFRAFIVSGITYLDEDVVHWSKLDWTRFLLQSNEYDSTSGKRSIVSIDAFMKDYLKFYNEYIEQCLIEMLENSYESKGLYYRIVDQKDSKLHVKISVTN
jgi:hypothetical protein